MKKIKVSFGRLEIRQILDDYISPTSIVPAPPMFIATKDEATMEFILRNLSENTFTVEETSEKIAFPSFILN
jgi:hypothetical protein